MGGKQFFVKRLKPIREQPHFPEHGHEIRVSSPARNDVEMKVIGHPRTGCGPEIESDIKTLRFDGQAEEGLSVDGERP